jgi:putative transposase
VAVRIVTRMSREVQVSAGGGYDLGYHVVSFPKYRHSVLVCRVTVRREELIRAKATRPGWRMVALEVMPDHLHLLVKAHPSGSPSGIANQLTGFIWRRPRAEFPQPWSRLSALWSMPHFVATVGAVPTATVPRCSGTQNERRWQKERTR